MNTISINELEKNKSTMTDSQWQVILPQLRNQIKPVETATKLTRKTRCGYIFGHRWTLSDNEHERTTDEYYVDCINDTLQLIRDNRCKSGKNKERGYVYHIYGICDLLKFEPNLQCTFFPDEKLSYFEVWLEKC